jgi:hypothetical protein
MRERDEFLRDIRERLLQAQNSMKAHEDGQRRDIEFDIGEWVWLRLQHRPVASLVPASNAKLAPRFYGPYQIVERINAVAYRLHLPARARLHDVFHVSLLKKFHGEAPSAPPALPATLHGKVVTTPQHVLRARLNRGVWEVLVQWTNTTASEACWVTVDEFKRSYPNFQLEDELFLQVGGNVVDSFWGTTYERRRRHPVAQGQEET